MKPKQKRLLMVLGSVLFMGLAAAAIVYSFRESMIFFYTPTQLDQKRAAADFDATRTLRIGGLVKSGSIRNLEGGGITFTITDLNHDMAVTYRGMVPSLFREQQGVVAQGVINAQGVVVASSILAKHDEKYMPREVVDALKASGQWQEGESYRKGGAP